jgi:CheY-like chemotaxis protein
VGPAPARFGLWFALALAVPAAFFALWLWLVPGGGIARARADEQRTASHVLAFAQETLDAELARHADERIVLHLDEPRRVIAPFADAVDTQHTAGLAEQAALAHGERGERSEALAYFAHAAAADELTPIGWLRYVDAAGRDDAARARALLQQATERHAHARCGGLPFVLLAMLHELRAFPPPANERDAWFDRFLVLARITPAAALLAALGEIDAGFDARVHALRAAATIALRHRQVPAPAEAERSVDGIFVQPVGERALAVVDPHVLGEARELALRSPLRSGPEWRLEDAANAPADAVRLELPPLGTTLAAVPTGTTTSSLLQVTANAAWLLALATFVVGNLLLWRLTRRELQLVRLRADFVDVVSHELRTPLAALSLKAEMLAHGDVPAERRAALRGRRCTRTCSASATRSSASSPSTGCRRVRAAACRAAAGAGAAGRALRAGRPALRLVGQQLEVDARASCRRSLRRRGADAAPCATCSRTPPSTRPSGSTVLVRAFASTRELVVEVAGPRPRCARGRTRGDLPAVRAQHHVPGPASPGSGLGLALVAAAAQSARRPRRGGPARRRRQHVHAAPADRGSGGVVNQLLVVEDDGSIRESLVDFFRGRDWLVTACADRQAADAALLAQRFHMVLLDLRLPDGDGLDVLRALRKRGDKTPVIVLTARGEVANSGCSACSSAPTTTW